MSSATAFSWTFEVIFAAPEVEDEEEGWQAAGETTHDGDALIVFIMSRFVLSFPNFFGEDDCTVSNPSFSPSSFSTSLPPATDEGSTPLKTLEMNLRQTNLFSSHGLPDSRAFPASPPAACLRRLLGVVMGEDAGVVSRTDTGSLFMIQK